MSGQRRTLFSRAAIVMCGIALVWVPNTRPTHGQWAVAEVTGPAQFAKLVAILGTLGDILAQAENLEYQLARMKDAASTRSKIYGARGVLQHDWIGQIMDGGGDGRTRESLVESATQMLRFQSAMNCATSDIVAAGRHSQTVGRVERRARCADRAGQTWGDMRDIWDETEAGRQEVTDAQVATAVADADVIIERMRDEGLSQDEREMTERTRVVVKSDIASSTLVDQHAELIESHSDSVVASQEVARMALGSATETVMNEDGSTTEVVNQGVMLGKLIQLSALQERHMSLLTNQTSIVIARLAVLQQLIRDDLNATIVAQRDRITMRNETAALSPGSGVRLIACDVFAAAGSENACGSSTAQAAAEGEADGPLDNL